MGSGSYVVTVKCSRCQAVYQLYKPNHVSVGSTTGPTMGQRCHGCQSTAPATVLSVVKA